MDRRNLLLSAASVALVALVSPLPTLATTPRVIATPAFDYSSIPIGELERIEQALDVTGTYEFDLSQRVALFGLNPTFVGNPAELRTLVQEFALEHGSIDVHDRIGFLIGIKQGLDERFGENDIAAQVVALDDFTFDHGMSLRDIMNTGHYMDLYYAARSLGYQLETS